MIDIDEDEEIYWFDETYVSNTEEKEYSEYDIETSEINTEDEEYNLNNILVKENMENNMELNKIIDKDLFKIEN